MEGETVKRSTPMKRSTFRTRPDADKTSLPLPKRRKCVVCKTPFDQFRSMVTWCCADCAIVLAGQRMAKAEKKDIAARKEAIKTIPELKAEAQEATNALVRFRDRNQPCICCNGMPKTSGALTGGSWDACHYRSRGSADHLRYNLDNIHRGLKDCNKFGHVDYRGGLIARIGIERVEALECDQTIVKWTADMLRDIRDRHRRMLKEMKANAFMEAA